MVKGDGTKRGSLQYVMKKRVARRLPVITTNPEGLVVRKYFLPSGRKYLFWRSPDGGFSFEVHVPARAGTWTYKLKWGELPHPEDNIEPRMGLYVDWNPLVARGFLEGVEHELHADGSLEFKLEGSEVRELLKELPFEAEVEPACSGFDECWVRIYPALKK